MTHGAAGDALGAGGEAPTLTEFLGYARNGVIKKALGVPDDVAARPAVPSGTSLAWLVRHLTVSEQFWLQGQSVTDWAAAWTPPPGSTIADLVRDYQRAARDSDATIATWHDLDQIVDRPTNDGLRCTARWILQHVITETARHAGHADILREQIDGVVGR